MKIKTYKAVKGWGLHGEAEAIPGTKRTLSHIIIGETDNDYIIEDMYSDIATDISKHYGMYEINVKIGRDPQVIILKDGKIVLHNTETKKHIEHVRVQIQAIPQKTLINAYIEMRINDEKPKKLSDSTMAVVAMVNAEKKTFYTANFIYCILKEYIENTYFNTNENEFAEELRLMEYLELLEISHENIRLKELQETKHPLLQELIKAGKDSESIESCIQKEIMCRFITGSLVERR